MSEQSDRESFDKRRADMVAHKTPDEMATELLNLQDAQARNAEESNRAAAAEQPVEEAPVEEPATEETEPVDGKKHRRR